jgi:hypothetical protein
MAIEYKYIIQNLQKQKSFHLSETEIFDNVVTSVGFEIIGEELIDGITYRGVHYAVCPLLVPSKEGFITYEELTENVILQAIQSLYPIEAAKLDIVKDIENQKNPITKEEAFPWGESE